MSGVPLELPPQQLLSQAIASSIELSFSSWQPFDGVVVASSSDSCTKLIFTVLNYIHVERRVGFRSVGCCLLATEIPGSESAALVYVSMPDAGVSNRSECTGAHFLGSR